MGSPDAGGRERLKKGRFCGGPWPVQGLGEVGQLTTVGRLIAAVHTVIVPVAHPDAGDAALGDGALELVGGAGDFSCRGR